MTEQALYFAMGVLITLLAGVLAIPVVSRRAWRLARLRGSVSRRSTEARAAANANSEIAVRAVEIARLNHRLAIAEEDALKLRTAVGRQSVQDIVVRAHASDLERSMLEMQSEADRVKAERADLKVAAAALQIALHDAFVQRDDARSRLTASQVRLSELMAEASLDRAKNAILSARAEELERLLRSAQADHAMTTGVDAKLSGSFSRETGKRSFEQNVGKDSQRRLLMKPRLAAISVRNDVRKRPSVVAPQSEARTFAVMDDIAARQASPRPQGLGPDGETGAEKLPTLDGLLWESEVLYARISAASGQKDTVDLAALRTSIARFGREARRLFLAREAATGKTTTGRGA